MATPRISRKDIPPDQLLVVVTLSEGTDLLDDRVMDLATAEAQSQGWVIVRYLGILEDPDVGILCHAFTAREAERP